MNYWLMKSEPDVYSLKDLEKDQRTDWSGVRNYQARNFMTQSMQLGDLVLFYHSNAEPSGIAGLGKITRLAQPDPLQFDRKSEYYDAKATSEKPIWFCVQVGFVRHFKNFLSLDSLKVDPKLTDLMVIKKGQRLSIQPVSEIHFKYLDKIGG